MNKSEVRGVYLQKRRELSPIDISEKSRAIADRFFAGFDLTAIKALHCFISIHRLGEIDTSIIYERIWAEFPHVRMSAPRMTSAPGEIESLCLEPETEVVENSWGICEPVGNEIIDPIVFDAVLIPVLCYDRKGNRVGYGKGIYDRFLAKCRPDCRKIGLSFFEPADAIDDVTEHDVPLDHCITPAMLYSFATKPNEQKKAVFQPPNQDRD